MRKLLLLLLAFAAAPLQAQAPSPEIAVIKVYEGMARYAEAAAADPGADRAALWRREVIEPYWQTCAEGGAYLDYGPSWAAPFDDVAGLRAAATALAASDVEGAARAAAERAAAALPGPPLTVCVLAADPAWSYLRAMHGIGGFALDAGRIWLTVLPEGDWADWVAYGIAHEYHHSAWMAAGREIADMGEYLVFEGRADAFARLLERGRRAPWTEALGEADAAAAWRIIEPRLGSSDAQEMQALMFGNGADVPNWAGYTLGLRLVETYLAAHPDLTVAEWTALPAATFLEARGR
jgi:uncharacterized protein YjaZ